MDDFFTYYVDMPDNISEMVTPCYDGYTVYINSRISEEKQHKALSHALRHIRNNDFNKTDVNSIESEAHKTGDCNADL